MDDALSHVAASVPRGCGVEGHQEDWVTLISKVRTDARGGLADISRGARSRGRGSGERVPMEARGDPAIWSLAWAHQE